VKVLVVDDDPGVLAFLEHVLQAGGYLGASASSPKAALEAVDDPAIRMIITDLCMPGEPSGLEFVRQLHAARPDCPIVVITGYPNPETLEECRRIGVNDFLTKPFEMGFVRDVLQRLAKEQEGVKCRGTGT